jgi:predicted protein tyrosine phosphatase
MDLADFNARMKKTEIAEPENLRVFASWREKSNRTLMSSAVPAPMIGSYWVLPYQLLAGEYPGEVEPEPTAKRLQSLVMSGIRAFIDLTDEGEAMPSYRNVLRRLSREESLEITYANISIKDGSVPTDCTMRCILDVIDRCIAEETPVFVHCWAGLGRTGAVVGCYLKRHGLAQDSDVIQKLAQLRKDLPHAGAASPQTIEQIRMVTTWKQGD